jgi:hypothetical protein
VSVAPDITETLPTLLGTSAASARPTNGVGWDVSIGGLGFLLHPTPSNPYERGTEPPTKRQIDTSQNPGEQSLSSWWVRTQNAWDSGAGLTWFEPGSGLAYYEPGTDATAEGRFGDSFGVDVWTMGQFSLLRAAGTPTAARAVDNFVCGLQVGGVSGYVEAYGNTVTWVPLAGSPETRTLTGGSATQPAAVGGSVWVGHSGGVSKYTPGSAPVASFTCTGDARVWWAKARLIVALGPKLYSVAAATGGVVETVGELLYTHPDAAWAWTDVAESAGAVLASGCSSNDSGIFRFQVAADTSGIPVLQPGGQVGRFPPGERVTCMGAYLGSALVLGTSMGVRVGQVSDSGDITYGPLTVQTANPVVDVTFRDRFAYLAVTAAQPGALSGAVRVDLSSEIGNTGLYSYAWDMSVPTSATVSSIALVGDRVVLCAGTRAYQQGDTLVPEGWLSTGRIRFNTTEMKAFRRVRCDLSTNGGEAAVLAIPPDGSENLLVGFTDAYVPTSDIAVSIPGRTLVQYLDVKVRLRPNTGATASPVVRSVSLKAVPAPTRTRLFKYPLSCFDREADRYGNEIAGSAYARVMALESMEETGAPVPVTDMRSGETFAGQIDSVAFQAVTSPAGAEANFGGVLTVTVRRL